MRGVVLGVVEGIAREVCVLLEVFWGQGFADAVFLIEPASEIHELAALAAEGAGGWGEEVRGFPAGGAGDLGLLIHGLCEGKADDWAGEAA